MVCGHSQHTVPTPLIFFCPHHRLPATIHNPPPTIHHLPPTTHRSPFTTHCPASTICCPSPTAHHTLPTIHRPPFAAYHSPFSIYCPPFTPSKPWTLDHLVQHRATSSPNCTLRRPNPRRHRLAPKAAAQAQHPALVQFLHPSQHPPLVMSQLDGV